MGTLRTKPGVRESAADALEALADEVFEVLGGAAPEANDFAKIRATVLKAADLSDRTAVEWPRNAADLDRLERTNRALLAILPFVSRTELAAADGRLRRNFQGYTDDQSSVLLGFGASAIGESPDGYVQNMTAIPDWQRLIFAGKLPVAKMRALSPEDRLRRDVIQALMCG